MTWLGYLSQVGGLLGFFLGFSIMSVVELLYWFLVRLGRRAKRQHRGSPFDDIRQPRGPPSQQQDLVEDVPPPPPELLLEEGGDSRPQSALSF